MAEPGDHYDQGQELLDRTKVPEGANWHLSDETVAGLAIAQFLADIALSLRTIARAYEVEDG